MTGKKTTMKRTGLEKALALGNRLATGAPKGRTSDSTPAERKAAKEKYGSKLKAPAASKRRDPTKAMHRATLRRLKAAGVD